MKITIVDVRCPICESDKVRSKVFTDQWWYICDNPVVHQIEVNGKEVTLEGRFYFTEDGSTIEWNGEHFTEN